MADGMPQLVDGPDGLCAKQGFELGEGHFDWIEIRAVGRQKQEPSSAVANGFFGLGALMGGEIVEDNDVAGLRVGSSWVSGSEARFVAT